MQLQLKQVGLSIIGLHCCIVFKSVAESYGRAINPWTGGLLFVVMLLTTAPRGRRPVKSCSACHDETWAGCDATLDKVSGIDIREELWTADVARICHDAVVAQNRCYISRIVCSCEKQLRDNK